MRFPTISPRKISPHLRFFPPQLFPVSSNTSHGVPKMAWLWTFEGSDGWPFVPVGCGQKCTQCFNPLLWVMPYPPSSRRLCGQNIQVAWCRVKNSLNPVIPLISQSTKETAFPKKTFQGSNKLNKSYSDALLPRTSDMGIKVHDWGWADSITVTTICNSCNIAIH